MFLKYSLKTIKLNLKKTKTFGVRMDFTAAETKYDSLTYHKGKEEIKSNIIDKLLHKRRIYALVIIVLKL